MTDQRPTELARPEYEAYPIAPPEDAVASPLAKIHRLLRGRYPWAIGIGLALAAVGAWAGATLPKALYTSQGLIDVAPKVPKILFESEEKGYLPMFDTYIASQVAIAGGRRVLEAAMRSPEWEAFGRGVSEREIARLQGSLSVFHPRGTQYIVVTCTDENPDAATVAVNQVIKAYMKIAEERDGQADSQRIISIEKQRDIDNARLQDFRRDILAATDGVGVEMLDARYQSLITEGTKTSLLLHDLDVDIAIQKAAGQPMGMDVESITDENVAVLDKAMAGFLEERAALLEKIQQRRNDGYLEKDQVITDTKAAIAKLDKRIAARPAEFRAAMAKELAKAPEIRAAEAAELQARRGRLVTLRDSVQEETRKLRKRLLDVDQIKADMARVAGRLDTAKSVLDAIAVESVVHGRISVLAMGERPVSPDTDKRFQLTMLGAGGGLALGFWIVFLWGLGEAKLRHVNDVHGDSSKCRFLGVVPDIRDKAVQEDGQTAAQMADFCVHNIRSTLQLSADNKNKIVVVTSPTPGAGKTTISLALGMSFAATGSRTLLVDCDFIGKDLTATMRSLVCRGAVHSLTGTADAAPVDGAGTGGLVASLVAARAFKFDDAKISELLAAAREAAGAGDPRADATARALEALALTCSAKGSGRMDRGGIIAALDGADVKDCAIETNVPNLRLLPVGDATAADAERLSPRVMKRLMESCVKNFDTVIIDTGPLLGSIEAAFAASVADDAIMVVTRGEKRQIVDQAMDRMAGIGAAVAGIVFNRATGGDVVRSSFMSRSSGSAGPAAKA